MRFPNYKDKHLLEINEAITGLDHFGELKKEWIDEVPKKCVMMYQWEPFQHLKEKYTDQIKKLDAWTLWGCQAYYSEDFVFVFMNGVGSPHAVMMFEELIVLGIKNFINIGTAGGLKEPGFFVCEKSIRDEGTSFHYIKPSKYAYPDEKLTEKLEKSFKKLNILYTKGTNWTVDAPMRETQIEVKKYKGEGVLTVEMEASALFAVAQVRKVNVAAAFFTSDIVGEKSENFYLTKSNYLEDGLIKLVDVAVECLSS